MPTLFDLGDAATALHELLTTDQEPPLSPEDEADALQMFLSVSEGLDAKIDGYCALVAEFEARAGARGAEAKRLAALAERDAKQADRLKSNLHAFMILHDYKKFETARYRVSVVANGGKVPLVIQPDVDPTDLDEQFHRVIPAKIELDKEAVRSALEAGEDLVFAKLGERGSHLRIK